MSLDLFNGVSTVDDGGRNAFDYYPTPAFMTRSLLHFHPAIRESFVLECASGGDAIANVLRREADCCVLTNDLDPRHESAERHEDATTDAFWRRLPRVEWVITNPPFVAAFDMLTRAVEHADVGVAFLLRKTFLEPTAERGPWLQAHPPTRVIGEPRFNFRGRGSDSVSCDWCLWERRPSRLLPPFVIDHLAEKRVRHGE